MGTLAAGGALDLSPLRSQKTTTGEGRKVSHYMIKLHEIIFTQSVYYGSIGEKGQLTQADNIDFSHSQPTVC